MKKDRCSRCVQYGENFTLCEIDNSIVCIISSLRSFRKYGVSSHKLVLREGLEENSLKLRVVLHCFGYRVGIMSLTF